MTTPRVSVVIATFNMGQYVAEAIRSVLDQTVENIEVVVVDDGSTDCTEEVLRGFEDDARIHVIRTSRQGQPKAKNAAWLAARGDFIAFCDADDYWLPDKLEKQLPLLMADPRVGVVYSRANGIDIDGKIHPPGTHELARGDVMSRMFVFNLIPFGTALVRRRCLEEVGGFDESIPMGIDWDLWLRISVNWEFDFVDEPTYVYRVWEGQMSHNWKKRYECAFKTMDRFIERHGDRLSRDTIATAYADTYTNIAAAYIDEEPPEILTAAGYAWKAVRERPTFKRAWCVLLLAAYCGLSGKHAKNSTV